MKTLLSSLLVPALGKRYLGLISSLLFIFLLIPHFSHATETTINIRIEGSEKTYFSGQVSITPCDIVDTTGISHHFENSAACGVVEAAKKNSFEYAFQDFGFGLFLTRIGTDNTPADFSKSWGFWLNDDSASAGLDSYVPKNNDNILLAFSEYPGIPLRISVPTEINTGEPTTIRVEKRVGTTDSDFVWHGTWEPAASAILHINGLSIIIPETGTITTILSDLKNDIWADGDTFIRSAHIIINDIEATPTPLPTPISSPTPSPTPSPTTSLESPDRISSAKKALSYLRDKQNENGSIDGLTTSIWSMISFGANEDRSETIKKDGHSLLSSILNPKPESATDIERLILALRASGQNPRSYLGTDYVALLKAKFDDDQFGEKSLINDDIFGILALLAADEPITSNYLKNSISGILKKQNSVGSWENSDLTAATIQALKAYEQRGGTINFSSNIDRAKDYLKKQQDIIGGFGNNSATTAWAIQAIVSLGEEPENWKNSDGKDPLTALLSYQNSDGGFAWKKGEKSSPFMTAYSVPALLFSPLPITKNRIIENNFSTNVKTTPSPSPTPTTKTLIKKEPIISNTKKVSITKPLKKIVNGNVAGAETASPPKDETDMTTYKESPKNIPTKNNTAATIGFSFANIGIGLTISRVIRKVRN